MYLLTESCSSSPFAHGIPNPRPVTWTIFLIASPKELPNNEILALLVFIKVPVPSGLLPTALLVFILPLTLFLLFPRNLFCSE